MLRSALVVLALSSTLGVTAQAPAKPSPSKTVVVHAAHMFDGISGKLTGPVTVTITDGQITSVADGTTSAPGATVIDLGSQTLLPGLIDVHKHMGGGPRLPMNVFQSRLTVSPFENAIGAGVIARKLLEEGFTTVRNMGSGGGLDLALKHDIDRGWIPGPHIIVSLEPLSVSGGHSDPKNGIDDTWSNSTWGWQRRGRPRGVREDRARASPRRRRGHQDHAIGWRALHWRRSQGPDHD
jgi:imidazolonepropionase-like amidohydrolase